MPRQQDDSQATNPAWLVYDGDCPVCSRYVCHLDAEDADRSLVLVNARDGGPLVREIESLPHDLNAGMALKLDGRYYLGGEALHVLAAISAKRDTVGLINRLLFRTRWSARVAYPLLAFGRRVLLRLMNVPPIDQRPPRRLKRPRRDVVG